MLLSVDSRTFLLSKINKIRKESYLSNKAIFKNFIILSENSGPQKFLSDLIFIIEKQKLAKITFNFFKSDIHLINSGFYSPIWKYFIPKNKESVILRLDGIGIDSQEKEKEKVKYNLLKLINKSSLLIYQSNFCRNCFLDIYESLPSGKVIKNGATRLTSFSRYAEQLLNNINSRFKGKFFSLAGRFASRKRINEVINQFNESDIGNLVVLSNVPKKLMYKNPRIIYLGMIDPDSARYIISKSMALIHFDRYDWCPNIVIGAISDGIPIICSNFGGTPEITGKNGLIIKEFPEDLPQNIQGIQFVKNSKFPAKLFKEAINNFLSESIKISFDKNYDMHDTAIEYVNCAKNMQI